MNLSDLPYADDVPDLVSRGFSQAELLYSSAQITQAIDRLAVVITASLQDKNPVLLSVLPGGLYLSGQLMGRLIMPLQIGYVDIDSGLKDRRGAQLDWHNSNFPELTGRNVLLVADVLTRGSTVQTWLDWLKMQGVESARCAVMVEIDAAASSEAGSAADFVGVLAPERALFGCGLDFCGYGRNLPELYAAMG